MTIELVHHGARDGVTGSCHELKIDPHNGILIDCGLFQGDEASPGGAGSGRLEIEFPIEHIKALVVTHVHIDHVGRLPYLLAAGFNGPIYCSQPSALLLPLVLEDALRVGVTRNKTLIARVLDRMKRQLVPLPYKRWQYVSLPADTALGIRLQRAGHILGSAYVECRVGRAKRRQRIVFSGDLGSTWTPLLPAPRSPVGCQTLVLESTYGDRLHQGRRERREALQRAVEHALRDGGTVLIPAFSIGRTQELLYELEDTIHRNKGKKVGQHDWADLEIVLDSPLAARFTETYRELMPYWDAESRQRLARGRHPLSFDQLTTIGDHEEHLQTVDYLARTGRPAVVIAAGGMCAGGRVVNYLKAMIEDPRHDILFVGYQARGTPGRDIQRYGPRGGYVEIDNQRYDIRAQIHTIRGYSAHADQAGLVRFVTGMRRVPEEVRLIHGDDGARAELARVLAQKGIRTSL